MKQNLRNYFEERRRVQLDSMTKEFLYAKIQKKIKYQFGIRKTLFYRSKLVSIALILAMGLGSFMTYYKSSNIAQADYVANVISRDGSYQVTFNNEIVDTVKTDNQIPDGGSIVLSQGAKVSIKTDNNATADIVGPAKITFQKSNNQLVVDIAYSDHVDIKNSTTSVETRNQDVLVVKTDNKTIMAKTDNIDISLDSQGSQQIIKNNAGEVSITSLSNNSVLALKSNESAVLTEETTLFAMEDEKQGSANIDADVKIDESSQLESLVMSLDTGISVSDVLDTGSLTTNGDTTLSMNTTEESIDSESLDQGMNDTTAKESTTVSTEDQSVEDLMQSKLVIEADVVVLLDKLYREYHYVYQKDITKVGGLIIALCTKLVLTCNEKDLKDSLIKVNKKIVNNYIVTADIKLVY